MDGEAFAAASHIEAVIDHESGQLASDFLAAEGLFRAVALDEFDFGEEADGADFSDGGVFLEGLKLGLEEGGEVGAALDEAFALDDFEVGEGRRRRRRGGC